MSSQQGFDLSFCNCELFSMKNDKIYIKDVFRKISYIVSFWLMNPLFQIVWIIVMSGMFIIQHKFNISEMDEWTIYFASP